MKKFITKVLVFILSLVFFLISIISITNKLINKNANFKINKKTEFVVFGHSYSQNAYNDSIILNFKNMGQWGESYFYSYQKTKKILSQNPQIKTVFIEFTNINISKMRDEEIWNEKYLNLHYSVFSPFINIDDHLLLMTKSSKYFLKNLSNTIKKNLFTIAKSDYNYIDKTGGFIYSYRNRIDSILNANKKPPPIKEAYKQLSFYNLNYLEKIIKYCKKKNKNIYLVRSPMHRQAYELQNEKDFQTLMKSRFNSLEFLDFKNFPIKNSEFADLNHLNYKGAKVFSNWFNKILSKGILDSLNKKEIIEKEINNMITKRNELNLANSY